MFHIEKSRAGLGRKKNGKKIEKHERNRKLFWSKLFSAFVQSIMQILEVQYLARVPPFWPQCNDSNAGRPDTSILCCI